jgi:serine/threonine-protein kinase
MDELVGRVLGNRFELLETIGEGGYGAVYLARQTSMDRRVAVKVIHPNLITTRELIARFEREARTASKLKHPNTVVYFDFGSDGDLLYLAMEYVDGRTLTAAINQMGRLTVEQTAHIAYQICGSLSEAHELGMVHRDLKPANVLLTERAGDPDFVKVIDFGLAKIVQGDVPPGQDLTSGQMLMGTPAYMAPEQVRGETVDPRCDIYALGVIMFVMLTGEKPFVGNTPVETAVLHLTADIPSPRTLNPLVPKAFDHLVRNCLSKDPAGRPARVEEVAAELEVYLDYRTPISGRLSRKRVTEVTETMNQGPAMQLAAGGRGPSGSPSPWPGVSGSMVGGSPSRTLLIVLLSVLVLSVAGIVLVLRGESDGGEEGAQAAGNLAGAPPSPSSPAGSHARESGVGGAVNPGGQGLQHSQSGEGGEGGEGGEVATVGTSSEPPSDGLAPPSVGTEPESVVEDPVDIALLSALAGAVGRADGGVTHAIATAETSAEEEAEARARRERRRQRREAEEAAAAREPAAPSVVEVVSEPEHTYGMLRINTRPGYANVYCNGRDMGTTPVERRVETGTYRCRVIRSDGRPFTEVVEVTGQHDGVVVVDLD